MGTMIDLQTILKVALDNKASDLHLAVGLPPFFASMEYW